MRIIAVMPTPCGQDRASRFAASLASSERAPTAEGPGSIIRVWPLEGGGPGNSEAFRILYRSTGLNGEPIEVSGAIHFPRVPRRRAGAT